MNVYGLIYHASRNGRPVGNQVEELRTERLVTCAICGEKVSPAMVHDMRGFNLKGLRRSKAATKLVCSSCAVVVKTAPQNQ